MAAQMDELITESLEKAKKLLKKNSEWSHTFAAELFEKGIPTLQPGSYRQPSPQIRERFLRFGRWQWATHGHWLGISDLEALWAHTSDADELLNQIRGMRDAFEDGWSDGAPLLFRPERLTLLAASDLNYQSVYLLWLECEDEPEVWVYDPNGESRYKDLAQYLQAYLEDDISAADYHWKLEQIAQFGK